MHELGSSFDFERSVFGNDGWLRGYVQAGNERWKNVLKMLALLGGQKAGRDYLIKNCGLSLFFLRRGALHCLFHEEDAAVVLADLLLVNSEDSFKW